MPIYEYECAKCKKKFEISQSIKDNPLTRCIDKKCKGRIKRLIGLGGGFILKGSGFYATDYRSSSYKEKAKKDSPSSPCHTCKEACETRGTARKE